MFDFDFLTRNHSWDANYWLDVMTQVQTMSDEKDKKIWMRALRRCVFEHNQIIVQEGKYSTQTDELVDMPIFDSFGKIYKAPITLKNKKIITNADNTVFEVVNCDSINAGKLLLDNGFYPAVLNMACEDGPGGGVIGGCYGQEEGLFRRTNLYKYMYPFSPHAEEYGLNPQLPQYPLKSACDGVYVKEATVFREEERHGYALLQTPFAMSFIAVPALRNPILQEGIFSIEDAQLTYEKIKTILRIGLINGHDALVLGAWGCGIFHNPPLQIAELFKKAFFENEFYNKFRQITFAILEDQISLQRKNGIGNVAPFKTIFES